MVRITATELQKQFGHYCEVANREPVSVTDDGQERVVLLSADEYKRLRALDTRQALFAWELPDELVRALDGASAPPETAQFDHECK